MTTPRTSALCWRVLVAGSFIPSPGCGLDHPNLAPETAGGGSAGIDGGDAGPESDAGQDADAGQGADAGEAGDAGGDAEAGPEPCRDLMAELCMNPTWLDGTIAFERGSGVSDQLWAELQVALDFWHKAPVWTTTINFVDDASGTGPLLRFTSDAGCGIVRRDSDTMSFALANCGGIRHIAREIGVALGLPRVHQRSDRDRHLVLAPESEFRCEAGQFFSKCPRPSELGSMFDPQSWLMFVPTGSTEGSCSVAPDGDYLYLPRATDPLLPSPCQSWPGELGHDLGNRTEFTPEGAALAELYAAVHGWQPARPVGVDLGPDRPLYTALAPGTRMLDQVGLVASDRRLVAVVPANTDSGSLELWTIAYVDGWGPWQAGPSVGEQYVGASGFAVTTQTGSPVIDAVLSIENYADADPPYLVHARIAPDGTATLSRLGDVRLGGFDIAWRGARLAIYANFDGKLELADTDGTSVSEWQPVFAPELERGVVASPSVLELAGAHHLVFVQGDQRLAYTVRDQFDTWSYPVELLTPPATVGVAVSAGPAGSLHIFINAAGLWHTTCSRMPCTAAGAWTRPSLIDGPPTGGGYANSFAARADENGIDLVKTSPGLSAGASLWHKRWQPF